ncbi:MAG: VCBS repeat-containing protein [Bacteroidia bacterium]|nr:VCBS repeat-containing protein [Bacteroidia bacterium]
MNRFLRLFPTALSGLFFACHPPAKTPARFEAMSPAHTRITFANTLTESDTVNILENEYIYNGGGVGTGDFNRDGLMDLFFSGNQVPNQLYLNRGNFTFEDITATAGVAGADRWSSGVSVVDLNQDGWPDIHVCATNRERATWRRSQLYINQGLNAEGIPVFRDMAAEYGLADTAHKTHAAFFDYDHDRDLDLFLIVDQVEGTGYPNTYRKKITDGSAPTNDRLYRNDWSETLGHPVFTHVSQDAGIRYEGYSLGVNITDLNQDGWEDIYITNDYVTNDVLYLNNQDGTFTNVAPQLFRHTSHSAMGNDVVDLNNDGHPEIVTLDMMPEDNYRKKTMLVANNYTAYLNNDLYGYEYQYVRNMLQVWQGTHPETGLPVYADQSLMAGIAATDWSWCPLVTDFDNDGLRDLIITNGFPKDITDRDFIDYYANTSRLASRATLLGKIPVVKLHNYAFRNEGSLRFSDQTEAWGITRPSFSNGAVYADLDNDGDMDYVVNNINDTAFVFQNHTRTQRPDSSHWLKVVLTDTAPNRDGLGTRLWCHYQGQQLYWEHTPYRGYISSMDPRVHVGLGTATVIDSLVVLGPDGRRQVLRQVAADQILTVDLRQGQPWSPPALPRPTPLLRPVSGLPDGYKMPERDYVDFNVQRLLPHKLSQYGPGLAVGDVDGNGLDDVYVTGSHFAKGVFFLQQANGRFVEKDLLPGPAADQKRGEELGALLFDADRDGDPDLYLVTGGYEFAMTDTVYRDWLYLNTGGQFVAAPAGALPDLLSSGSCVRAADYDRDGDLDLFVGGRVEAEAYPRPVSSYLLRNESTPGQPRFVVDQAQVLSQIGLVCDALWTDANGDGWVDLLLAGEWMPVTLLENRNGTLVNVSGETGISQHTGWWNSLAAADLDEDGDMDYLLGNLGLNTYNQASEQEPVSVYAADFDQNGSYDAIPTVYFPDEKGSRFEVPFLGRLDLEKQLVTVKRRYLQHALFGRAGIADILSTWPGAQEVLIRRATWMRSAWAENLGGGKFVLHAFPLEAQTAPVYGMLVMDLNGDGHQDVVMTGNDYGTELTGGRYDAGNGWVMLGDGRGGFRSVPFGESGFFLPGDSKALSLVAGADGQPLIVATQNKGPLRVFRPVRDMGRQVKLAPDDHEVVVTLRDGRTQRMEAAWGHTFLSQGSRCVYVPADAVTVEVRTFRGERRILSY